MSSHSHLGCAPDLGSSKHQTAEIHDVRRVTAQALGRGNPWIDSCFSPLKDMGYGSYLACRGGKEKGRQTN